MSYSENDLLSAQDCRVELNIGVTCFWNLRKNGDFPEPVVNISQKMRRWRRRDVDAFKKGEWQKEKNLAQGSAS